MNQRRVLLHSYRQESTRGRESGHQSVREVEDRGSALVQVHLVVEGRGSGGLPEVDGAILHPEDAVGSGTGGGGEDATPCASSYGIRALVTPVGSQCVGALWNTGMHERVKASSDGAKGEVTIGTYGCGVVDRCHRW